MNPVSHPLDNLLHYTLLRDTIHMSKIKKNTPFKRYHQWSPMAFKSNIKISSVSESVDCLSVSSRISESTKTRHFQIKNPKKLWRRNTAPLHTLVVSWDTSSPHPTSFGAYTAPRSSRSILPPQTDILDPPLAVIKLIGVEYTIGPMHDVHLKANGQPI